MDQAPELETERLYLRGHRVEDFEDSAAMWADPQVTRYIGCTPFSRPEVWSRLLRHRGHWALLGFGYWVVRQRGSNRFVGEVGFFDLRRDIRPSFEGKPESGWALAPWAHGRGFATEALGAILAWGDANLPSSRTVCAIERENAASIRVAKRCGYLESHQATLGKETLEIFERVSARPRK